MLERTAGCLENAGRRFFLDSNTTIRSRRGLYSSLGRHNITSSERPNWRIVSRHTLRRRSSSTKASASAARTTGDSRTPVLEFLYPSRTQEYAVSLLLRSSRGSLPRRRKKTAPGVSRTFVSEAASLHHSIEAQKPVTNIPSIKSYGTSQRLAKNNLLALLENGEPEQNDRAWELYILADRPVDVTSALLARLSNSPKEDDYKRVKRLFKSIPDDALSTEDYLHLTKSCLGTGKPKEVGRICQEAIAKGRGVPCWSFCLAHFVNNSQWLSAKEVWDSRPSTSQTKEKELWNAVATHLAAPFLQKNLLALPRLLQDQNSDNSTRDLARFFLDHSFADLDVIQEPAVETLLLLLQRLNTAGVLKAKHYFNIIKTLQDSESRPAFVRSIVVYRNFRWLMDGKVPSITLLNGFLRRLALFEITTGVQYFLDDYTFFHHKPTPYAYKQALITFSRAGEVSSVERVFEKFVSDYKNPSDLRMISPLLYVHARLGNFEETERQFGRISDEFGLKPNTVCWNILLTAYANANDLAGCFEKFKMMVENNVEPTSYTFGILMGLCANRGDIDSVRQLLSWAKQRQVQITAPLLDTVVEAYCNDQKLEMAESVAESCLGLDVKGSRVRMWNILLWNHAFRMDLESISRIRQRMDAAGLEPDGMTFAALMLSLVLLKQTDSARRILRTLHRSHRMHATEFHYAIILYGYVRDRNRDMVHIIFREIQARFNRPGLSSRLLVLKSQLQRDLQLLKNRGDTTSATIRLENAEKLLAETITEYNPSKLAAKKPAPGIGKQPLIKAFPAMYYEYVITAYGKRGSVEKVGQLFDQYLQGQPSPKSPDDIVPLRLLTALMLTYLKADQYRKVEECWEMAFLRAQEISKHHDYQGWLAPHLPSAGSAESPGPPLPILRNDTQPISLLTDNAKYSDTKPQLLQAFRHMLSRPLSLFMRSLAYRNETKKISRVISDVENAGFSLTTFNWSTYVQMLASSDKPSEQLYALALFEKKFMPNFPGWNNLRRGYGLKPPGVPSTIDSMENPTRGKHPDVLGKEGRRYWSKVDPEFLQPTYVSMVYLASALQGVRERSIHDGGAELKDFYRAAPKTIEAIADMPYLREKFQGVLLRRREEQGDTKSKPGREPFVWTGGILGVGGRRRIPFTERANEEDSSIEQQSEPTTQVIETVELSNRASTDNFLEEESLPIYKSIDYEDEFDLEAESLLATRRRLLGTNEELLDSEHREYPFMKPDADDENENSPFLDDNTNEDEAPRSQLDEKAQEVKGDEWRL